MGAEIFKHRKRDTWSASFTVDLLRYTYTYNIPTDYIEDITVPVTVTDSNVITVEGFRYLGQHGLLITQNVSYLYKLRRRGNFCLWLARNFCKRI